MEVDAPDDPRLFVSLYLGSRSLSFSKQRLRSTGHSTEDSLLIDLELPDDFGSRTLPDSRYSVANRSSLVVLGKVAMNSDKDSSFWGIGYFFEVTLLTCKAVSVLILGDKLDSLGSDCVFSFFFASPSIELTVPLLFRLFSDLDGDGDLLFPLLI